MNKKQARTLAIYLGITVIVSIPIGAIVTIIVTETIMPHIAINGWTLSLGMAVVFVGLNSYIIRNLVSKRQMTVLKKTSASKFSITNSIVPSTICWRTIPRLFILKKRHCSSTINLSHKRIKVNYSVNQVIVSLAESEVEKLSSIKGLGRYSRRKHVLERIDRTIKSEYEKDETLLKAGATISYTISDLLYEANYDIVPVLRDCATGKPVVSVHIKSVKEETA